MAKWVLPEGRKPLPDEWFAERAQMQDRIKELEAKQKKAAEYFAEIILHCANFGRGVPSIDERIIGRCEDTAANAIEYLAGGKDAK